MISKEIEIKVKRSAISVYAGSPLRAALLSVEKNMKAFLARLTFGPAAAGSCLAAFLGVFFTTALLGASAACRERHNIMLALVMLNPR